MTDLQIDYGQLRSDKLLTDVTHRIFFKVVHLPCVPILRYRILKDSKSERFPLLKRGGDEGVVYFILVHSMFMDIYTDFA